MRLVVGLFDLFHGGMQKLLWKLLHKVVMLETPSFPSMFRRGWGICRALSIYCSYSFWVGLYSSRAGGTLFQWWWCISVPCFAQNMADACIKFNARLKCLNVVMSLETVCSFFVQVRLLAGFVALLYVTKMQSCKVRLYLTNFPCSSRFELEYSNHAHRICVNIP